MLNTSILELVLYPYNLSQRIIMNFKSPLSLLLLTASLTAVILTNDSQNRSAHALSIVASSDADALVNSILGEGITVVPGSAVYSGQSQASGFFSGGMLSGLGIDSGIILTTGSAFNALGPNNSDSETTFNGFPGDSDLNGLIPGFSTFDAASLTFKFTAETNSVNFEYVFASEEYNEFTNSSFNDVFGFFLNGVNIANIPGSSTAVSINNVNGGNPLGEDASNSAFFNNNDLDDGGPFFDIQYDGFTVVFSVFAPVNPGENEIKLAIADAGDSALDSAVFISGGTFQGELPGTTPENPILPDMIDDGSFIFDDVSIFNAYELFFINPDIAVGYVYQVSGVDFTEVLLPNVGDNSYNLLLDNSGGSCSGFSPSGDILTGGIAFNFASPTPCFAVDGIEVSAALDPTNPLAFVTGLKVNDTGVYSFTQTPIVENSDVLVPEPLTLLGAATAVGFMARFKKHLGRNSSRNS
ncbi:MAG: PEP-CTERM sorting domain-containing protein [Synechocystis sp.]